MPHFYSQSRRSRIRQMRLIALDILKAYSIDVIKMAFISSSFVVFRVWSSSGQYMVKFDLKFDASEHDANGPPFHPPGTDFRLQMLWVDALARETDLELQHPIRNSNGDVVTTVSVDGIDEEVGCVVCTWLPGRVYSHEWKNKTWAGPKYIYQIGRIAATMHNHMQKWTLPESYKKPQAGWQRPVLRAFDFVAGWPFVRALSKLDYKLFENGLHKAISVMDDLGTDPEHFGMIHEDLCEHNLILHKGQLSPIDFGNAVFGYYLWDMIHPFSTSRFNTPEFRPRHRAFMKGYREVRQLPDNYVEIISTIFMIWAIGSVANSLQFPKALKVVEQVKMPRALWIAERYIKGEKFLDI